MDYPARSFDLLRPGVTPPLAIVCKRVLWVNDSSCTYDQTSGMHLLAGLTAAAENRVPVKKERKTQQLTLRHPTNIGLPKNTPNMRTSAFFSVYICETGSSIVLSPLAVCINDTKTRDC